MTRKIKSIYFHNPSPKGFEQIIKWYHRLGYRFISMDEFRDILEKKENKEKLVIVTLDDGWQGNLVLLPIVEKYHVPITIFVAVEPLYSGNYWWEYVTQEMGVKRMFAFKDLPYDEFNRQLSLIKQQHILQRSSITVDELRELAHHPLVSIHSHTVNHPILTQVPSDVLHNELIESKKQLEDITGSKVYAFSYPNGSLTQREVNACRKVYALGFTTEQRHISLTGDPYLLPRMALTGSFWRDILKCYGIWYAIKRLLGRYNPPTNH